MLLSKLRWKFGREKFTMKKIFFIVAIMTVFCLGGCGNREEGASGQRISESLETVADISVEIESKSTKPRRVVDILSVSGDFKEYDEDGYRPGYIYQIPQFNAESDSAKVLNERIVEELYGTITAEVENILAGNSLFCHSVTYEVFEYGDIVSILVTESSDCDIVWYEAYSYDFANDKEVTNVEMLAMNGWTEDTFLEEAYRREAESVREAFKDYPEVTETELNQYIQPARDITDVDIPMYVGEDGSLNVYVPFPSLAGPEWVYQLEEF